MKVILAQHTSLAICAAAARTCWDSSDKSDTEETWAYTDQGAFETTTCGPKDKALLDRIGNKFKHASILEHLVYTFDISGISRALLQEFSRHRMASLSVKSSRYTLKELKDEELFNEFSTDGPERAAKYLVWTGNDIVDNMSIRALEELRKAIQQGIPNDLAKYCMPESYKTELSWTINARSLQNFLSLRSDKAALWEIRQLAHAVYDNLPTKHQYLFENHIKDTNV